MGTWAVEFERVSRATIFVDGDTAEDARADATELVGDEDWEDLEATVESVTEAKPPAGREVWSGGPSGTWRTA